MTLGGYDYQDANNWLPVRISPQPSDILEFTKGGISTANNVPSEPISQLFVRNNTNVTFEALTGGARTLSVNGPALTMNIEVESGSALQLGGTAAQMILTMAGSNTNQTATIAGTLNINDNTLAEASKNQLTTSGVSSN